MRIAEERERERERERATEDEASRLGENLCNWILLKDYVDFYAIEHSVSFDSLLLHIW
jgi:hypothetical protein